jgi:hypothetical protein
VDGGWHMRAYSSFEQALGSWVHSRNVYKDRVNSGLTTGSGGWTVGMYRPINGYWRISRNLYKTTKTTIEWNWFGTSYNDHAMESQGWVTLDFPIEDIYSVYITNQGQESIWSTRFFNLTPELGSAEPHLQVASKTEFDALTTKDQNTLYLIKQTP